MDNLPTRLLAAVAVLCVSVCLSGAFAHQYNRGSFSYAASGWPSYRPHQVAGSGNPVKGPWGMGHWPGTSRPSTAPTTPLADRLGTAETVYPYPPPGQPPIQNSVLPNSGCQDGTKLYKVGDKWTPEGGCGRVTCLQGGKTTTLGCPKAEPTTDNRCSLSAPDPRQPWPLCCPQLRC